MTDARMAPRGLMEKRADGDQLREMIGFAVERLLELEVGGVARWLTAGRDRLTTAETSTGAAVDDGVPAWVEVRGVAGTFRTMVRATAPDRLDG